MKILYWTDKEKSLALQALNHLKKNLTLEPGSRKPFRESSLAFVARRTVATAVILGVTALISGLPYGAAPTTSVFRIAVQIPGRSKQQCRPLTAQEKSSIPRHMQKPEICETVLLDYRLRARVDGSQVSDKVFTHHGVHGDSPILIHDELEAAPGRHNFEIELTPVQTVPEGQGILRYQADLDMELGKIRLLRFEQVSGQLELMG